MNLQIKSYLNDNDCIYYYLFQSIFNINSITQLKKHGFELNKIK